MDEVWKAEEIFNICTCSNAFLGSMCLLRIPANSAQSEEERLERIFSPPQSESCQVEELGQSENWERATFGGVWTESAVCRPICRDVGSNFWPKMHHSESEILETWICDVGYQIRIWWAEEKFWEVSTLNFLNLSRPDLLPRKLGEIGSKWKIVNI